MVDAQDTHIGPPAGASLLDRFGGHVEHPHKANRAAGHPAGGVDRASRRAQAGEREAGAAPRFVNQGGLLDRLKNGLHAVGHRQHEAGGQLAERPARVHQGRGVGQEFQAGHQAIELLLHRSQIDAGFVGLVRRGNGFGHPAEQLLHRFGGPALVVTDQIAALQHRAGILRNFHSGILP